MAAELHMNKAAGDACVRDCFDLKRAYVADAPAVAATGDRGSCQGAAHPEVEAGAMPRTATAMSDLLANRSAIAQRTMPHAPRPDNRFSTSRHLSRRCPRQRNDQVEWDAATAA